MNKPLLLEKGEIITNLNQGLSEVTAAREILDKLSEEMKVLDKTCQRPKKSVFARLLGNGADTPINTVVGNMFNRIDGEFRKAYNNIQKGMEVIAKTFQAVDDYHGNLGQRMEILEAAKQKNDDSYFNILRQLIAEVTGLPTVLVNDGVIKDVAPEMAGKRIKMLEESLMAHKKQQEELLRLLKMVLAVTVDRRDAALGYYCAIHGATEPVKSIVGVSEAIAGVNFSLEVIPAALIASLSSAVKAIEAVMQQQGELGDGRGEMFTRNLVEAREQLSIVLNDKGAGAIASNGKTALLTSVS